MFDFKKLLTPEYLFSIDRIQLHRSDKLFLTIGAALVVLGILCRVAAAYSAGPVDRKLRQRFAALFLTIGLSEVVWFAFRYQLVRFFGSHFVALVVLLAGTVWGAFILKYLAFGYRRERAEYERQQLKARYLPS